MANPNEVTLERAIAAIETAADEIPADQFINYSTILDVHLSHALSEFSSEEQGELLETVEATLLSHQDLARDIAWDLVAVILPFLESPESKTVEAAERIIAFAAKTGNPREVFIKVLEALSLIPWNHEKPDVDDEYPEDGETTYSEDEDKTSIDRKPSDESERRKLEANAVAHSMKKLEILVQALCSVHPRIATKFPSRFLSTELTTLLGCFIKAVEGAERDDATRALRRILEFVKIVYPKLSQRIERRSSTADRPPLPPRISTTETIKAPNQETQTATEGSEPESLLQARLVSSFLSHILETYLLRAMRPGLDDEERGMDVGWAGKYDDEVVRPKTSRVPGGRTLIDEERARREAQTGVWDLVDEISWMCEALGLSTTELLEFCQTLPDGANPEDSESEAGDIGSPNSAADVPLSKHGSLFLLAHRLSTTITITPPPPLQIFPEHSKLAEAYMIYGPGQSQPAVIDAILFLGALSLDNGGLGDVPDEVEPFMMYLQVFAVISTNARSPQARFLGHYHVSRCLRAHPNEAVRLAYIKDTLEHCPFESLKAAIIGILKDEIIHATTPVPLTEESSIPSTPISIFGTPLCLQDIFDVLFPDLEQVFGGAGNNDKAWERFQDLYARLLATVNLYLFLLLSENVRERLGVIDGDFGAKVEQRFLAPLRSWSKTLEEKGKNEAAQEVGVMRAAVDRVGEVRAGL
ncbi:DUF1760-domain-containing protein [Ascodesmis nigricans]|uniref:DUF1760-domain-containing protein n=1 Tax=Ascodesmis nigricans TaxID=341454 RepID=A0A4S2MT23_9PEZI|nr:DUF1760-domain-containing protein [Ascodesmis nigricans]